MLANEDGCERMAAGGPSHRVQGWLLAFAILELRLRMRLLYLVFIASIAALLWAAWAMARTIRRHGRVKPSLTLDLRDKAEKRDSDADTATNYDLPGKS